VPRFREGRNGERRPVLRLRCPGRRPDDEGDAKGVVPEPAGGVAIGVGVDGGQRDGCGRLARERQAEDAGEKKRTGGQGQMECLGEEA